MLKRLTMLAVLAILSACCPNQCPAQDQHKPQTSPESPVTIVDNSIRQDQTDRAEKEAPESHAGIEWAQWALVVVGLITFGAVFKQARESAEASNAMRESVRLQEILNQQWVDITGWRKEGFSSQELNPPRYTIAMEVGNSTKAPLTLNTVYIGVPGKAMMEYEINSTIAPSGTPIKITYSGEVEPELIKAYEADQYPIIIQGQIVYINCFEKTRTQPFRQACFLGPKNHCRSIPISEHTIPVPNP